MKKYVIALCLVAIVASATSWKDVRIKLMAAKSAVWTPNSISPVAWYKGDGDATDSSASGYDASWSGTAAYTTGVNGQAFDFGGANAVVKTFESSLSTTNTTIALWAKRTGGTAFQAVISQREVSPAEKGYYFNSTGGNLSFRPATGFTITGSISNPVDEWIHMSACYDGAQWCVYTNGVLAECRYDTTYAPAGVSSIVIGALSDGGPRLFFIGEVDDVLIFNKCLTADEVTSIYEWRE